MDLFTHCYGNPQINSILVVDVLNGNLRNILSQVSTNTKLQVPPFYITKGRLEKQTCLQKSYEKTYMHMIFVLSNKNIGRFKKNNTSLFLLPVLLFLSGGWCVYSKTIPWTKFMGITSPVAKPNAPKTTCNGPRAVVQTTSEIGNVKNREAWRAQKTQVEGQKSDHVI